MWGISRNTRRWWSLESGEEIGYYPEDDAEKFAAEILAGNPASDWGGDPDLSRVGGPFCRIPLGTPAT